MIDTKTKILDAAERLFARKGFDATSMRHIIADAGVNLAAIHYHFGSKEELLLAVVRRRVGPVNDERLRQLDEAERHGMPDVEQVLRAFFVPAFRMIQHNPEVARLVGRLYGERDVLPNIFRTVFGDLIQRFSAAMRRALPQLPGDEFVWRMHFSIGAMAHTLRMTPVLAEWDGSTPDPKLTCERLIAYVTAGLNAPVARLEESQ